MHDVLGKVSAGGPPFCCLGCAPCPWRSPGAQWSQRPGAGRLALPNCPPPNTHICGGPIAASRLIGRNHGHLAAPRIDPACAWRASRPQQRWWPRPFRKVSHIPELVDVLMKVRACAGSVRAFSALALRRRGTDVAPKGALCVRRVSANWLGGPAAGIARGHLERQPAPVRSQQDRAPRRCAGLNLLVPDRHRCTGKTSRQTLSSRTATRTTSASERWRAQGPPPSKNGGLRSPPRQTGPLATSGLATGCVPAGPGMAGRGRTAA
jgi:hypothetical protein